MMTVLEMTTVTKVKSSIENKHAYLWFSHFVCILQCHRNTLQLDWCARRWIQYREINCLWLCILNLSSKLHQRKWEIVQLKCVPHAQYVHISSFNQWLICEVVVSFPRLRCKSSLITLKLYLFTKTWTKSGWGHMIIFFNFLCCISFFIVYMTQTFLLCFSLVWYVK